MNPADPDSARHSSTGRTIAGRYKKTQSNPRFDSGLSPTNHLPPAEWLSSKVPVIQNLPHSGQNLYKLRDLDSNQDNILQRDAYYRYTIPQV